MVPEHRAIAKWVPPNERPEAIAERERQEKRVRVRDEEAEVRMQRAQLARRAIETKLLIAELVEWEFRKYLRLSQQPDFANTVGPLSADQIIKLAEIAFKEHRLDNGQATDNVAVAIAPQVDFSKLTQEQRDAYRAILIAAGVPEVE